MRLGGIPNYLVFICLYSVLLYANFAGCSELAANLNKKLVFKTKQGLGFDWLVFHVLFF